MANPRWAESSVPRYLPDRVAQLYYAHGLFCASHAVLVLVLTSIIILMCSYPLSNLPLPGNVPQSFSVHDTQTKNITAPRWFFGQPKLYIQQVIVKSTVSPWNEELLLTDAFRGPLAESFKLVEVIHNFQYNNDSSSLDNMCLHIENIKKKNNKMSSVLPEYNCLLLSPANLWQQDINKFHLDSNLINTIYNYQNFVKGKISISEMLFGLPLQDAGIKRYPLRKKQRVIQFAITLFMTRLQSLYIDGLHQYLKKLYPSTESLETMNSKNSRNAIHIYFPEDVNYGELIPLTLTYVVIFMYMYFSMRKMEFIKSKICMAFGAFITILASLSMTIGICFFFGLEFTGSRDRGKQLLPYLVIIVGLENVLVLVKSVVSTTPHLDVKIRLAQGLSKEGWNITKNLLVEVTILTAGLLTFVPAIQEFCIFAIVGVLSDFFLQIVLFSTILSLNVECAEPNGFPHYSYYPLSVTSSKGAFYMQNVEDSRRLPRSQSHPRLTGQNVVASIQNHKKASSANISKRVKVVHFWARTRFVQRTFMVGMVLWISMIIYNADTIQNFIRSTTSSETDEIVNSADDGYKQSEGILNSWKEYGSSIMDLKTRLLRVEDEMKPPNVKDITMKMDNSTSEHSWLKRIDYDTRRRLSLHHWSSVLSLYNISLAGSYITILPVINVVHVVPSDIALALRNPNEKGIRFRWQSLAAALDPLDFPDIESTVRSTMIGESEERIRPFIPSSPMEIFMTALLCIVSVFVVAYTFVVLYRCICSRNYAEWRSSWSHTSDSLSLSRTQIVMEALPIVIEGHTHLIECVATDGNIIASTCLGGELKIWDALSGELVTKIERNRTGSKVESGALHCDLRYTTQLIKSNSKGEILPFDMLYDQRQISCHGYNFEIDFENRRIDYIDDTSSCESYSPNVDSHSTQFVLDRRKKDNSPGIQDATIFNDKSDHGTNIPIWCIDCRENMVLLGCVDGCLEFWDCITGKLKCMFVDDDRSSITAVKLFNNEVLAARLNGSLSFYKLNSITLYATNDSSNGVTKHRRGHYRTCSVDSMRWQLGDSFEELRCIKLESSKAHTKPITVLGVEGGRAITGSEDRTLKVFQLENHSLQYTFHGHGGPITCVFIDRYNPTMAGSGSQDGLLCVWDLHTGACMYSIQAHDGCILALTYSASYVISLGLDERLCVWDRFQGHLLNTIPMTDSYCTSLCMLTHNLLITSKQGCLIVLDAGTGETIRVVKLGSQCSCVFVNYILNVEDGIVCDYGDQLRLVRFPLVCDKND